MLRYMLLLAMLSLFVVGCSEESNMLAPVDNLNTNQPNWISLPNQQSATGMSIMSQPSFQESQLIDGKKGGTIKIDTKYKGGPNGEVKIKAELEFPKNAFEGRVYFTMNMSAENENATFLPHAVFNKPAKYNLEFKGLDLSGIDPDNVDFVYQAEDGSYEKIDREKIEINIKEGKVKVKDAELPHFSRYGFVR